MTRASIALVLAFFAFARTNDALACSVAAAEPFVVDGTAGAGLAPQPPKDLSYSVTRGRAPKDGATSTCDDTGIVKITLTPPSGDVGYVVEQLAGVLPDGVALSALPVRLAGLQIVWLDGATDSQERLDFTIRLAAVDRSGRQSAWSAPLRITDGGAGSATPTSCAASPHVASTTGWAWACALAAVIAARRKRTA